MRVTEDYTDLMRRVTVGTEGEIHRFVRVQNGFEIWIMWVPCGAPTSDSVAVVVSGANAVRIGHNKETDHG